MRGINETELDNATQIQYNINMKKTNCDNTVEVNKIYRHFKGDLYLVTDIATHSETLEKYVVYRALYGDNKLWIRPLDMFIEEVENKPQKHRFEPITIDSMKNR